MINHVQDTAVLHNNVEMPWLGLGVFRAKEGGEVENAVKWALEVGYRSIDTASFYDNEAGVGRAIEQSNVPRDDIFVTTKVWNSDQGYDETMRAFEASLKNLTTDYIDLYLIHWPVPGKFKDTWRALEAIYESGRVRAIGVSNFLVNHLEDLLQTAITVPMVNQVEFHPYLQQPELQTFCRDHDIQLEAWSPIMRGQVLDVPELVELGHKYNKSAVQVTLRWMLQHRVVTIPKSVKQHRIESNADIFDFELAADDMALIDGLDRGERLGPDPNNFDF